MCIGIIGLSQFIISSILLTITPGVDCFYILGKSIENGKSQGMASVLGISAGLFIHTLLVASGLSLLLSKSIILFNILKISGACYLLFLGVQSILHSRETFIFHTKSSAHSQGNTFSKTFYQGLLVDLLNPKAILFFMAFLPQYVLPENANIFISFLTLGIIFISINFSYYTLFVIVSSKISSVFQKNKGGIRFSGIFAGCIYIILGLLVFKAKN